MLLPVLQVLQPWPHTIPPGADSASYPGYLPGALPGLLHQCGSLVSGDITSYTRTDILNVSERGVRMVSFFDHFYNRIHVTPAELNLGNVTANTSVEVELWNAYLTDKDVVSSSLTNDAGVVVDGEEAPFTLSPLSFRIYDVTVLQDGPATISLSLGWVVETESVGFTLTAVRIVPFFYLPNWERGISETLEWRTTVGASFNGEEQRQQIRSKPRRSWTYQLLMTGDNTRNVYFDILGFQNKTLGLPVWADKSSLLSQVVPGNSVIEVDTVNKGFTTGGIVFLQSGDRIETHEVDSLTSNHITLSKPVSGTFHQGDLMYPGAVVQLPQSLPFRRLTDGILQGDITANGVPQDTDPHMPTQVATDILDGFEVVHRKPNWAAGIETVFGYEVDELDYLSGIRLRAVSRDYPSTTYRLRYLLKNRADIQAFRAMLARLKGRYTPAFVNLYTDDFRLSGLIASSATGFQVYDNHSDLGLFPQRHPVAVSFITTDNGTVTKRLNSIELNESGLLDVQITEPVGVLITEQTVKRIVMCPLCRLASDQVTLTWLTDSVAECELTWQVVSR